MATGWSIPFKPGATQTVAYTATAGTITNPISDGIQVIRVWTTSIAFIKISAAGTAATTSDIPLPASTPEYFIVPPGQKVSAIRSAADGTLFVTEMSR